MALKHRSWRCGTAACLLAGLAACSAHGRIFASPVNRAAHTGPAKTPDLVPFAAAPYPIDADSLVPGTGERFFGGEDAGRRFHDSPRGGRYYEDLTYADPRSLVVVPPLFDPYRPAALVVFFHGNLATLSRDVVLRQKVVAQVEASRLNALLVGPQLAVDALDSSPGRFYEPGFLDAYLGEAAQHLADRSGGKFDTGYVARLPVILVAYSGGYLATAYCLHDPSASRARIRGVLLLDALFGEEPKFADWIAEARDSAFFVSAYSPASMTLNATLAVDLARTGVKVGHELPPTLVPGDVVLKSAPGAVHNDFVTAAWTHDPLQALLSRVKLNPGR